MKSLVIALLLFFAFNVNQLKAQNNIMDLDPQLIAAALCNGMIAGNTIINYDTEVLSEERARIMIRTTYLSFFLTAIKYKDIEHLRKFQSQYDSIYQEEINRIFTLIETDSFDWDTQAELDVCAARLFDPLTSVSKDDLAKVGIKDYFEFSKQIQIEADKTFDFLLSVTEAME